MSYNLLLDTTNALEKSDEAKFENVVLPVIRNLKNILLSEQYERFESSVRLSYDRKMIDSCLRLANKYQDIDIVMIIGIGGSNLGTLAVQEALLGKHHNMLAGPTIMYADTIDPSGTAQILDVLSNALDSKKRVLINVVSKSGTTTETVANAELCFGVLREHGLELVDSVVVTTDKDSKLWQIGLELQLDLLEIPKMVGGRYSVFSPVGLFPLAVLGIPIEELVVGANQAVEVSTSELLTKNPAAQSALSILANYNAGRVIHNTFCFAPNLEGFGRWYRQLTGESLGKLKDLGGGEVHIGIMPIVSIGSTDLHSAVQLYLSGPDNTLTTFVRVMSDTDVLLPAVSTLQELAPHIEGKSLLSVFRAITDGTLFAYRSASRPYIELQLPDISATSLGMLLQMKMIEVMYLGALLNVNAFDQPAVEIYKTETRRLLAQ